MTSMLAATFAACEEKSPSDTREDAGIDLRQPDVRVAADVATNGADVNGGDDGVDAGTAPDVIVDEGLTWFRDILPIANKSCVQCHTGGGIGTFSIDDPTLVPLFANAMADAVAEKRMPPWTPSRDCRPLQDERSLPQNEIDMFVRWAAEGATMGDINDAPVAPPPLATIPNPDAELFPSAPYIANDITNDDYRCFILDPALSSRRHVTSIEYVPDNEDMVHHIVLYLADRNEAEDKAASENGQGWECFGGSGTDVPVPLGAWAPGIRVVDYPEGTGIAVLPNQVVVAQVHYNLSNVSMSPPPPDRSGIKLKYAEGNVREAVLLPFAHQDFTIPPNTTGYVSTGTQQLPVPVEVHGVMPHLHQKAKNVRVTATGLDNSCVIDIPEWDFDWQQLYLFADGPVEFPFLSTVSLRCEWDNPTDQPVEWGDRTTDEMCLNYFYAVIQDF